MTTTKISEPKTIFCDIDGVLTDGTLILSDRSGELKAFHVRDGLGLVLLRLSGVHLAVITTSNTPIVEERMKSLGISHVYMNQINKITAYEDLLQKLKLTDEQVAYVGDDLPDMPLIQRCGLGVAVANAVNLVRDNATWITQKNGGQGAVREVCDLIMHAQETHEQALQHYLSHGK